MGFLFMYLKFCYVGLQSFHFYIGQNSKRIKIRAKIKLSLPKIYTQMKKTSKTKSNP